MVNLHYYASESKRPVDVNINLSKVNPALKVEYYDTITLEEEGDEKTAFRFRIDRDGDVGGINFLPKQLVSIDKIKKQSSSNREIMT
ncbi:MAG: hypothetical protein U5P41_10195 [Gammaproteobacteria bacterium]|nr:hypothetical protein [Gammaproteobacteria bacterium]